MKPLTRKDIAYISDILSVAFKKAASYVNKKYDRTKVSFDYEFLIADTSIVLYYHAFLIGHISENRIEIIDCFKEKANNNLPGHLDINDSIYTIFIIPSIIPSRNDFLFEILGNSYSILIPTSTKHGLNIVNDDKSHPLRELTSFMKENMVWWWRRDDGPNDCSIPEDDCSLREYVISILQYT